MCNIEWIIICAHLPSISLLYKSDSFLTISGHIIMSPKIYSPVSRTELFGKDPARIVEKSVKGMLPKNKLGAALFRNLNVVVGSAHTHEAQKPKAIDLNKVN